MGEHDHPLTIKPIKTRSKVVFKGIPKPLPDKSFSALLIGSRGSGKSTIIANLIRIYKKVIPIQNRFLISPTALLDDTLKGCFEEGNVFTQYHDAHIKFIINLIEADKEEQRMRIFEKTVKQLLRLKKYEEITDPMEMDQEELQERYEKNLKKHFKPEAYLLVVDDSLGTFPDRSELTYLFTRHRHHNLSLIMSTQTFRAVPTIIRTNSVINMIFDTNDKEKQKLSEEYCNFKKVKCFEQMMDKYAHGFNFLTVNRLQPKKHQYFSNLKDPIDMGEFEDGHGDQEPEI